jgi:hypothetical protein
MFLSMYEMQKVNSWMTEVIVPMKSFALSFKFCSNRPYGVGGSLLNEGPLSLLGGGPLIGNASESLVLFTTPVPFTAG